MDFVGPRVGTVVLAFLLGGAVGLFFGKVMRSSDQATTTSSSASTDLAPPVVSSERSARSGNNPAASLSPSADSAADAGVDAGDLATPILQAVRHRDYFRRKHDLYELGLALDAEGIHRALEASQQLAPYDRYWAQPTLIARWFELDAAAAFNWIGALSSGEQRSELFREFFHSGGLKDPDQAVQFLGEYAKIRREGEDDFTYSVFQAWSEHDLTGAIEQAVALPDKSQQASALNVTLERLAEINPGAAIARVNQLPDSLRRSQLANVLSTWASTDAMGAWQYVLALPAEMERDELLSSVIDHVALSEGQEVGALLAQIPEGRQRTRALRHIVQRLDETNPKIAAEYLLALPPTQHDGVADSVARNYARKDLPGALAWAAQLPRGDTRPQVFRTIIKAWSEKDPKAAADYCLQHQPSNRDALTEVINQWASQDAPSALAWARGLPPGEERENTIERSLVALAADDAEQALAMAGATLSAAKQGEAREGIIEAWAERDPRAAAEWALRIPNAEAHSNELADIAAALGRADPVAAAAWIDRLRPGAGRDSAISAFAYAVLEFDPEGAAAWAETISAPDRRDSAIVSLISQWQRYDKDAALAWINQSGALSEKARRSLLQGEQ